MPTLRKFSTEGLSEALLAAEDLPTVPAVALKVLELCRSSETTLEELARAIERDPALSVQLLRFANSPAYGMGAEVANLQRATMVLGTKTVQLMSLSISLAASLPREGSVAGFELGTFWHRSLVRAVSARLLASIAAPHHAEEAFLCGLLQEIGRFALARCLPEEYAAVTEEAHGWPSSPVERRLLGFDHIDVATTLLDTWGLPPVIGSTLVNSEPGKACPPEMAPELALIAYALQCADRITDLVLGRGTGLAFGEAVHLMEHRLGLTAEQGMNLLGLLDGVLVETSTMLEVTLPSNPDSAAVLGEAERDFEHFETQSGGTLEAPELSPSFLAGLEAQVSRRIGGEERPLGLLLFEFVGEMTPERLRPVAFHLSHDLEHPSFLSRFGPSGFALLYPGRTPRRLTERARGVLAQLTSDSRRPIAMAGGATLARASAPGDAERLVEAATRFLSLARSKGPGTVQIHPRPLVARP